MKIKIIEPFQLDRRYDVRSLTPNLGPVIVATLLKESGHEVEVLSEYVSRLDPADVKGADLVGISITTCNARRGFDIARRSGSPVVFGGMHASLMPVECLLHGDFVIRGDGHSIVDLAAYIESGRLADIGGIANLVYKTGGRIVFNRGESRAVDVVPDFGLVRGYGRLNLNRLCRIPLLINASRGCQYNCSFCAIKAVYGDVCRKSKETVIADIRSQTRSRDLTFLAKLLPRNIWITDDNFFADPRWAKDILRDLAKMDTGYTIMIQARIEVAKDAELLDLMRKAGVVRIYLGIEALTQGSLDVFRKKTTLDDIRSAVAGIKEHRMDVHGLFVFGDDNFRIGDGAKVAEFVKEHRLDGALIQPLTPFPGTGLFLKMKAEGRILHERWEEYNGKVVFAPKNMIPAALQREIAACYRKIYSNRHILEALLVRKRTARLAAAGDAVMRRIEVYRMGRYIDEKLTDSFIEKSEPGTAGCRQEPPALRDRLLRVCGPLRESLIAVLGYVWKYK